MKGYSACIEMLFPELEFTARARAALDAGFQAVEFWRWHNKDLAALTGAGVPVAAASVDSRDDKARAAFSKVGMLAKASRALFYDMVGESIAELRAVGSPLLIIAPGQALSALSRGAQADNIVECLLAVKPLLEKSGASLAVEPLNPLVDHIGCYLSSSRQAFDIARAADSPNIGVLFDIYHQQITEGNVTANLRANLPLIKHFHTADVPGRHEPGTGEINYANVVKAIREAGYEGYIGCEFRPTRETRAASEHILSL